MIDSETRAGIGTAQLGRFIYFLETKSAYEKQRGQEFFNNLKKG